MFGAVSVGGFGDVRCCVVCFARGVFEICALLLLKFVLSCFGIVVIVGCRARLALEVSRIWS